MVFVDTGSGLFNMFLLFLNLSSDDYCWYCFASLGRIRI